MKLSIQSNEPDVIRVAVAGEISQKDVSTNEEPLAELLGEDCYNRSVLLDMHAVEGLDSSGVGWLLMCQKRFKNQGGNFILHSLSPFVRDVLRILNMHLVFKLAADDRTALELIEETAQ